MLKAVSRRAPKAVIIIVDYPKVLPKAGTCALTPLSAEQADRSRVIAGRLEQLTQTAAKEAGVLILRASALSKGHDVCAKEPWMNGFGGSVVVPYHPNLDGMTAIAKKLDAMLKRQ
jgi:hypothetical protein